MPETFKSFSWAVDILSKGNDYILVKWPPTLNPEFEKEDPSPVRMMVSMGGS